MGFFGSRSVVIASGPNRRKGIRSQRFTQPPISLFGQLQAAIIVNFTSSLRSSRNVITHQQRLALQLRIKESRHSHIHDSKAESQRAIAQPPYGKIPISGKHQICLNSSYRLMLLSIITMNILLCIISILYPHKS
jgi:hypothetical protein